MAKIEKNKAYKGLGLSFNPSDVISFKIILALVELSLPFLDPFLMPCNCLDFNLQFGFFTRLSLSIYSLISLVPKPSLDSLLAPFTGGSCGNLSIFLNLNDSKLLYMQFFPNSSPFLFLFLATDSCQMAIFGLIFVKPQSPRVLTLLVWS